jgi:hypothetical protein
MIDHSFWRDLRLASGCSCLSLAMRRSRFLCANPPTRIPSICPGAHMGNVQIAPLLGSCPWALGPGARSRGRPNRQVRLSQMEHPAGRTYQGEWHLSATHALTQPCWTEPRPDGTSGRQEGRKDIPRPGPRRVVPVSHSRSPAGQNLDQMDHPAGRAYQDERYLSLSHLRMYQFTACGANGVNRPERLGAKTPAALGEWGCSWPCSLVSL